MWISKKLAIYINTWKWSPQAPKGPFFGKTSWSNSAMRGTSFYHGPSWAFYFWLGRRMVSITRNCAG